MTIDLITRAEWDARAPKGAYTSLSSTKGVKVHYTGGHVDPAILENHSKCFGLVQAFQRMHMNSNGWIDLGYTMVACPHRKVFVGRGPHHLPAANGAGLNSGHYAVLGLVGNSGLTVPTDEQLLGILDAIDYLREKGRAGKEIEGHRDGYSTDCPGGPLYAWVKRGAPRPAGSTPPSPPPPTPVKAPPWPGRVLQFPPLLEGADVGRWQWQMRRRGWDIEVDAQYGPQSADACRDFQTEKGLDPDGKVGPLTWRAAWEAPITSG